QSCYPILKLRWRSDDIECTVIARSRAKETELLSRLRGWFWLFGVSVACGTYRTGVAGNQCRAQYFDEHGGRRFRPLPRRETQNLYLGPEPYRREHHSARTTISMMRCCR